MEGGGRNKQVAEEANPGTEGSRIVMPGGGASQLCRPEAFINFCDVNF